MRFSMKYILPLFSSTTVFGSILGSTLGADGLLQSISSYGGSEACISELTLIKNCIMSNVTKEKLEESCSYYNSPTCQQFFDDPLGVTPSCQENSVVSTLVSSTINLISLDLKVKCQNDENNTTCPLAELELTNENASNDLIKNAVTESCNSKICRENTLNFIENAAEVNGKAANLLQSSLSKISGSISEENLNNVLQDQTNNNNELSTYLEILKSDSCKTQSTTSGNATSDATSIIYCIKSGIAILFLYTIFFYLN